MTKTVTFKSRGNHEKIRTTKSRTYFLSDKHFFQLKDLQAAFSISKRTALRDIEELESMGLAFYVENGRYGGYRLINQSPLVPIYFNKEEIQAIFFALKALDVLSMTPFNKSYTHISKKLFSTLSDDHKTTISRTLEVINYYNVAPVNELTNLEQIFEAAIDEKIIRTRATQLGNKCLELQILELFYRNGIWFVSAYDSLNKTWGTFRCDCLEDIAFIEESGKELSKEELINIRNNYEETYHDIPFKCRLTNSGKETFKKNNYPNMVLEEIDGIAYIVGGYNQAELGYMINYLLSFGKNMTVEYPAALRKEYLKQLQEMMSRYD